MDKELAIVDSYIEECRVVVINSKHRTLEIPLASIPSLKDKPLELIQNFEIDPDGSYLYWPDLDVHLGWQQFLQIVDPNARRKAEQASEAFNRRYGIAIRKVREAAQITQTQIDGLTDRQVRRIENGECRATVAALAALAQAHGMGLNDYLHLLSKTLT